jgi:hypothetical protein
VYLLLESSLIEGEGSCFVEERNWKSPSRVRVRGFQANVSYTYSHALDEGSGLGLFFNGNNPLNPGQSYGNSDFVPPCDPTGGPGGGPLCDTFESAFGNGGRNIFRGPFQKRADISLFKDTAITERVHARYSFDVFNLTNTPSFDTPNNNVSFALNFNNPPTFADPQGNPPTFPGGNLGVIQHTIGSPRLIRISLHVTF